MSTFQGFDQDSSLLQHNDSNPVSTKRTTGVSGNTSQNNFFDDEFNSHELTLPSNHLYDDEDEIFSPSSKRTYSQSNDSNNVLDASQMLSVCTLNDNLSLIQTNLSDCTETNFDVEDSASDNNTQEEPIEYETFDNPTLHPFTPTIMDRSMQQVNLEPESPDANVNIDFTDLPYLYDFSFIQEHILSLQINSFPVSKEIGCSLALLKIFSESNIPNSAYSKVVNWHQQSNDMLLPDQKSMYSTSAVIPKSKKNVLELVARILCNSDVSYDMKPIPHVLQVPSQSWMNVTRFPLKPILYSLFLTPGLMDEENCWLYDEYYRDPSKLANLSNTNRYYGDLHTGSWFANAHRNICQHDKDILIPIILFCDATIIDSYGRLSLDAILLTLGCFKKHIRNQDKAWRLLGYVPNLKDEYNQDDVSVSPEKARIDYHHVLSFMLKEVNDLEKSGGILYSLPCANGLGIETVRLRFSLMLVSGDAPGLDKLADMYCSYTTSSNYLCRDCKCPTESLDDHTYRCVFIEREEITSKQSNELKDICFYKVPSNAFDKHYFGGDTSGINGCSPPEILHQFLLGVVKMLLTFFSNAVTSNAMKLIDSMIKFFSANYNRQSSREFPDVGMFKDGFSKTHLTGKEFINQLFVLYISLIQTYSMERLPLLDSRGRKRTYVKRKKTGSVRSNNSSEIISYEEVRMSYRKILSDLQSIKQFIKLLEHTLCFSEWIHQESIPFNDINADVNNTRNNNQSQADIAIRKYMNNFTSIVTEVAGNKTRTAKIHWMLHYPHYVSKFGSLMNYDGGIGERMLKSMVKQTARKTQKRQHLLAHQACTRYYEKYLIDIVHLLTTANDHSISSYRTSQEESSGSGDANNETTYPANQRHERRNRHQRKFHPSGYYNILFDENDHRNYLGTKWKHSDRKSNSISHNEEIIKRINHSLRTEEFGLSGDFISCFTTLKFSRISRKDTSSQTQIQNVLLRSDPCYYGRPWMDWCITEWKNSIDSDSSDSTNSDDDRLSDTETSMYYPSRIYMFIDPTKMDFNNKSHVLKQKGTLWAVVKSTINDPRTIQSQRSNSSRNNPRIHRRINHECKLMETFKTENFLRIISVDAIIKEAFVVGDSDKMKHSGSDDVINRFGSSKIYTADYVMLMKDKEQWSSMFINDEW